MFRDRMLQLRQTAWSARCFAEFREALRAVGVSADAISLEKVHGILMAGGPEFAGGVCRCRPPLRTIYYAAAASGARPDPLLTISQWADKYRKLFAEGIGGTGPVAHGSHAVPAGDHGLPLGRPRPSSEWCFMKGAQIGGTECGNN